MRRRRVTGALPRMAFPIEGGDRGSALLRTITYQVRLPDILELQ